MTAMRVARVTGPRQIRLDDAAVPTPGPGEALVRIQAVGICGSDLHYYAHGRIGDARLSSGHILGHEVSGVVAALGPGTTGPAPGTPVAVDPAIHCGACRFCVEGNPNLCKDLRFFGSPPVSGGLQEYLTHPARLLYPLPAGLSLPVGATVEALGVAIHAADLAHLALGTSVAVFGCGPVGLMIAGVAQLAGARLVCVTEPLPHRRKIALQLGVAAAFDPAEDDVVAGIKDRTGGDGVDVAFEVAGSSRATAEAVRALRPGGTLVLVGYWEADEVTLPGITAMRKGLTLRFVRRMKHTFPRALDLVARAQVNLGALVSHEFPLARVAEAFARAEQRSPDIVKAVVLL
jgi:L-iditol 2-dehydrogenase